MPTRKKHLALAAENGQSVTVDTFMIKKSVFHANADGTTEIKVIGVDYFGGSDVFEIELPAYLAEYRTTGPDGHVPNGSNKVRAETAAQVVQRYETLCENYSRWRLSINGQRMLWVGTHAKVSEFAQSVFGIDASVALGLKQVSRFNDKTHGDSIVVINEDGHPQGEVSPVQLCKPILIPDTPENRAKVQSLIESIATAAAVIEGARTAADPAAYIQAINDRWATDPVQPDLFTSVAVSAAEKASVLATSVDDEEL